MQSFRTENQTTTFQREDEQIALQRAKLEGRHETEDEHLSEPSTVHSLSHFEEHETPTKTPKSSEILQKGFHKATDTIAQGVEVVKNLLTTSQEKVDQAKESISQEVSDLQGDLKQKAGELKGKAVEKFGEEIQPEKDLDQEVKEHIKEVNEEIKHQPHGEEEVVEGQGQAKYKTSDLSSQKASDLKGKLDSQLEGLKQKASEFKGKLNEQIGEEIQPEKDLDQEVKEQIQEVNEEIRHQPHGEEEVVEGQGQAGAGSKARFSSSSQKTDELKSKASSQLEGLKQSSKEIMDKASAKVDELKQKAGQQAQSVKEQAQEFSSKASGKTGETRDQGSSQFEDLRSVSKEILDKALGKIDEMRDKASQQGQQIKQETKSASNQLSQKFEQKASEFSSQTQDQSHTHVEIEEGSQPLTKDAKEEILELAQQIAERIQELETEQKLQPQSQSRSQSQSQSFGQQQETISHEGHEHHQLSTESRSFVPTEETHELVEKVKEGLEEHVPLTEVVEEFEHEHYESSQPQEKGQPVVETLRQTAQELSSKISHKINVRSRFAPSQQGGEFKQEFYQPQERPQGQESSQSEQPIAEQIKQGAQEASNKISETVQEVKESVSQKAEKLQEQRKPLVDKIMDRVHSVSDNFTHQVEEVRSVFKVEKKPEKQEGEVEVEVERERKPIVDVIQKNITDFSSKLSHNVESVKSKAKPIHEESSTQKPAVREQPAEVLHEQGQSLRQRISGGIDAVSGRLSQHVENVKHRFMPEKGERDAGEFYKVKEGFSETVGEYKHEQRLQSLGGEELQSENPFEPFEQLTQEQLEQRTIVEKVKESFYEGLENLKVKLGKEPWSEEIRDVQPVETVKEESKGLKQKLSGNLEGLKGKFRHGKEEAQQEVSKKISENQPIEQSLEKSVEPVKQEGQSLKQKLSGGLESFKGRLKSGKEEAHEEVSEKIGEIQPIEKPTEGLQQESKSLKQRISGQLHEFSDKIYHNIEAVTGKFKSSKEEGSQNVEGSHQPYEALHDEEPAESSQGGQSLKQKIAGQIGSLKGRFGTHKGEEAQEQEKPQQDEGEFQVITEGIDETVAELKREQLGQPLLSSNPFQPLESRGINISQPLSNAEQIGGDLNKLTSAQAENQPAEQPIEPVKEGGQSLTRRIAGQLHNISSIISQALGTCKGRLRHQKREVHEEVSEKISENQPIEQPLEQQAESSKQESHSLKQKLTGGFESFKGRFKSGKQEVQEEASQKVEEVERLDEPAEAIQEQGQSIKQKLSGGLGSLKGKFKSGKKEAQKQISEEAGEIESQPVEQPAEAVKEGGQSLKQKIGGQFQGIFSKLSQNTESIKGKFSSKKDESQEDQEEQGQKEGQQDEGEFHIVKEGIHETVSELRKEQASEPLLSSNPFQPLGSKDINISQPLSNAEQVGGNLNQLTARAGIDNVESEEESAPTVEESKSLLQKVKGGFIGATSMISKPFSLTKEKVMSVFRHENKENIALLGLLKDIEEKCLNQSESNNENTQ